MIHVTGVVKPSKSFLVLEYAFVQVDLIVFRTPFQLQGTELHESSHHHLLRQVQSLPKEVAVR